MGVGEFPIRKRNAQRVWCLEHGHRWWNSGIQRCMDTGFGEEQNTFRRKRDTRWRYLCGATNKDNRKTMEPRWVVGTYHRGRKNGDSLNPPDKTTGKRQTELATSSWWNGLTEAGLPSNPEGSIWQEDEREQWIGADRWKEVEGDMEEWIHFEGQAFSMESHEHSTSGESRTGKKRYQNPADLPFRSRWWNYKPWIVGMWLDKEGVVWGNGDKVEHAKYDKVGKWLRAMHQVGTTG